MSEIKSDEMVPGSVYKIYDRTKNNTIMYNAAEFVGLDGDKGNKFELLNRSSKQYVWIRPEEMTDRIFTKINWKK